MTEAQRQPSKDTLTVREREVWLLMAKGFSRKKISKELGIGKRTVDKHCENLFCKLGVENKYQALYAGKHLL